MRSAHLALAALLLLIGAERVEAQLYAAVLPSSRSVQAGTPATAFATVINAGTATAHGCSLALPSGLPMTLTYQSTDPATNAPVGTANAPVDVPAGGSQSFVFVLAANAGFQDTIPLVFTCADAGPAPVVEGLNTLHLSVSADPVPDVIAIAVTPSHDGIATVPGAFAVAAVNVGVAAPCAANLFTCSCIGSGFEVSAVSPVPVTLCATNPSTGECTGGGPGPVVDLASTPGVAKTLSVFMTGTAEFAPALRRATVTFREYADVMVHANVGCLLDPGRRTRVYKGERGATSVAVGPP